MVHRPVCDRVVDLVPDPDGRDPRSDGPPGHPLPRPGQHLQHRHHQHPQGAHTERQCFLRRRNHLSFLIFKLIFTQ